MRSERPIIAGLYLSIFDSLGLTELGFGSFVEAFNVIEYALGTKPASIKNYRDHAVAAVLKERFFLFVVKNFRESPIHEIFRNPLSGRLQFKKHERRVVQISFLANV